MSAPSDNSGKSPLDAAQKIVAELTGLTPENQILAVKFASETLGLQLHGPLQHAAVPQFREPQSMAGHAVSGAAHTADIRSFTASKAPKSDQQFCAIVAYFYQFEARMEDRKETIDSDVMKEAARLAGRPQVERWNMTLTNAKNAGYLDLVGNGKFKLSSVGENLVAITLPDSGGSGRSKPSKKLKPKVAKKLLKKKR